MELWTEYEGRTLDGAFTLDKLLLPEGRSAFFSTSNSNGVPTLVRLIASHFDEEEILARWRGVEALGHPNLLKIERYGQLELDDTTVVYAIFEPVDATLADVIVGQRLSLPEARQLTLSLASALDALHQNGFVHEHLEPAKVFAVGEVVKLRGDCIRETPEGETGQEAKKKDIHDLAVVALLALTQTGTLEDATRIVPLPSPFDEIVRGGLNGTWGLSQMMAALETRRPAPVAAASAPRASSLPEKPVASVAADRPPVQQTTEPAAARTRFVPPGQRRLFEEPEPVRRSLPPAQWIALSVLALLLVFWLIWHATHRHPAAQTRAVQSSSAGSPQAASGPSGTPTPATSQSSIAKPSAAGHSAAIKNAFPPPGTAAGAREQWRVVAFTYNRSDQAQKKVETIAQRHANLHPEVFTPTGHAPYLVTVGGVMSRDQALLFVQQVRRQGLPRDTYAQNYSGKRK